MDALDVFLHIVSNSSDEWILWFWVHIDGGKVLMGNNVVRKVVGMNTIQIKTHNDIVKTLTNVRHVLE